MAADLFANNAQTTLAAAITAGAPTLTVTSSASFPAVTTAAATQFRVLIDTELFIVTNVTGTTWTVTPATEGTTAAAHALNAPVTAILTAAGLATRRPVLDRGTWLASTVYAISDRYTDPNGLRRDVTTAYTSGAAFGATDTANTSVTGVALGASLANTVTAKTVAVGSGQAGTATTVLRSDALIEIDPALIASLTAGRDSALWGLSTTDVALDGTATPTGFTKTGNVYTVSTTAFLVLRNLTINSGITLVLSGFLLYVTGTLTNNGTIHNNGAGTTTAAGASANNTGGTNGVQALANSGNGGNGSTGIGGVGSGQAGALPNGPSGSGGAGGASGSGSAGGAAGGYTTSGFSAFTQLLYNAFRGIHERSNYQVSMGGTGGGGGGGDGTSSGGGGGQGGGGVIINAKALVNNGAIQANGGNGAPGQAGNAAGGGGGGAGAVLLNLGAVAAGTGAVVAAGGAGGTGVGTGQAGVIGGAGSILTRVWV